MHRLFHAAIAIAVASTIGVSRDARAATDPNTLCHRTVVKQLEKFKKTQLKLYRNCLDKQNRNLIAGPCLDLVGQAKLDLTEQKVAAAVAKKCTPAILTALGYRGDCQYDAATPGVGGTCAALPVTTATEFATCMMCWKGAEFARYAGTLYASHATEVCGALDDTSLTCSPLGCATPLPTQRDLGDNAENDCQRTIAKASLNYLLKREKILDKCLLRGLSYGACLADPKTSLQLAKAATQKETLILKACNNYEPVADPPWCCRTGPGQACMVATDRTDCLENVVGGTVVEGRTCDSGSCQNIPGPNKSLTWWEHCPTGDPCPGPTLGDIDGVIDCIGDVADGVVSNVLCLQFPNGSTCPTPVATSTPEPSVTPTP